MSRHWQINTLSVYFAYDSMWRQRCLFVKYQIWVNYSTQPQDIAQNQDTNWIFDYKFLDKSLIYKTGDESIPKNDIDMKIVLAIWHNM